LELIPATFNHSDPRLSNHPMDGFISSEITILSPQAVAEILKFNHFSGNYTFILEPGDIIPVVI
ncbi:MAG: hypothetical protein V3V76_10950, partial [Candidatus Adiutricales bacterium]